MKKNYIIAFVFLLFLFQPFVAFTQNSTVSNLKVDLKAYLVATEKDEKGIAKEILEPLPETVMPGAVIQYEIVAFNTSKGCACTDTLKEVALFGAVPEGTIFIQHSETTLFPPMFSIDGGKTFSAWPVKYKVIDASGKAVEKVASADMITGLKWVLSALKPQETISLVYRVMVKADK